MTQTIHNERIQHCAEKRFMKLVSRTNKDADKALQRLLKFANELKFTSETDETICVCQAIEVELQKILSSLFVRKGLDAQAADMVKRSPMLRDQSSSRWLINTN
jgi:hypothetical protein